MIAVTQARGIGPGKDYLDKTLARGKTRKEALRLLRRQLSDAVFTALLTDEKPALARTRATTTCSRHRRPAASLPPHRGPRPDPRLRGRPVRLPPQAWVFVDHLKPAYA